MSVMKAVRMHEFGDPSVLLYEDVERPSPGPGEVLVRVRGVGVNALDWKIRQGVMRGFMDFPLPLILGCDVAGVVESVGSGVTEFAPGHRVFGMPAAEVGMYAEFAVLAATELAALPDSIGFQQGAALPTVGLTAWQALFEVGGLKAGQRVLVHGASGGVGSIAVQLAALEGAQVVATASGAKREFVKSLGALEVIDYKAQRFEEVAKDIDLVLDVMSGETRTRSWQTLRRGGAIVSTVPPFPTDEDGKAVGGRGLGVAVHPDRPALTHLAALAAAGKLKSTVDQALDLRDAAEAHRLLQAGKVQGKIVLTVGDQP